MSSITDKPINASFNNLRKSGRGNKQLIYCTNPSKKTNGMKISIQNNWESLEMALAEIQSLTGPIDDSYLHIEDKSKTLYVDYSLPLQNPKRIAQ